MNLEQALQRIADLEQELQEMTGIAENSVDYNIVKQEREEAEQRKREFERKEKEYQDRLEWQSNDHARQLIYKQREADEREKSLLKTLSTAKRCGTEIRELIAAAEIEHADRVYQIIGDKATELLQTLNEGGVQ